MDLIQAKLLKDMQTSLIFIHSSQWGKLQIDIFVLDKVNLFILFIPYYISSCLVSLQMNQTKL